MSHKPVIPRAPRGGPDERYYNDLEQAIRRYEVTLTPAEVAANTTAEQTFTVSGVNSNDTITVNSASSDAGLGIGGARATASDTVAITFINATAGALTPTSEEYVIIAIRG